MGYYKSLLIVGILIKYSLGQCPRVPSPSGYPSAGGLAPTETDCALRCTAAHDCFAYLFKPLSDFNLGPNSFSSNCILQTAFDRNIFAEELLKESEYTNKICVRGGSDLNYISRFIKAPKISIAEAAAKEKYIHRVEFPDQNVAKFFKIITLGSSISKRFTKYYTQRLCANDSGLIATPYTTDMAKIIYDTLNMTESALAVGHMLKIHLAPDGTPLDYGSYLYVSGKIGYGYTSATPGTCNAYADIKDKTGSETLVYSNGNPNWQEFMPTLGVDGVTNLVCEFQGTNYAQWSKIEATTFSVTGKEPSKAIDGIWNIDSEFSTKGYESLHTKASIVVITLPQEIAVRQVKILPDTDQYAQLMDFSTIYVSNKEVNVPLGVFNPLDGHFCGTFQFSFQSKGEFVYSIVCEKCLIIGKYVIFDDLNDRVGLGEIGVMGFPLKLE